MRHRVMIYIALIFGVAILSQSCNKESITPQIENNSSLSPVPEGYFQTLSASSGFGDRITRSNQTLIFGNQLTPDSISSPNQANTRDNVDGSDNYWVHIGEVEPYVLFGETLSATHIAFMDDKAFISYHRRGNEHMGAIEIIDLSNPDNPEVVFRGYLSSADVNAVEVGKIPGSEDIKVWLSLSDSKKGAVLAELTMAGGTEYDGFRIVNLSKFIEGGITSSANSVTFSGDYLYVSSGKTHGGAFCLNAETLEVLGAVEFENGKYIDVNGSPSTATKVVSLQTGENSSLRVEDIGSFHFSTEYGVGEILHQNVNLDSRGKSTLHFTSNNPDEVLVTKGKYGLSSYNIYTGAETWSAPSNMLTSGNTNGISSDDEFIYVANGADGLAVFSNPGPGGTPELVFTWDMNESQASANFIEIDGSTEWILIAKGQGGTKILRRPQAGDYLPISDFDSQGVPSGMIQEDICDVLLSNILTAALPEGQNAKQAHPEFFANDVPMNLYIEEDAEVSISFVHEGAGYKNVLGYYYYDADNPPSSVEDIAKLVVFPNYSAANSGGGLLEGNTVELMGNFKANSVVAFFINSNGFVNGEITQGIEAFYTDKKFNFKKKRQSVILNDTSCDELVLCFDDQRVSGSQSGDKDFNDAIFQINVFPQTAVDRSEYPTIE